MSIFHHFPPKLALKRRKNAKISSSTEKKVPWKTDKIRYQKTDVSNFFLIWWNLKKNNFFSIFWLKKIFCCEKSHFFRYFWKSNNPNWPQKFLAGKSFFQKYIIKLIKCWTLSTKNKTNYENSSRGGKKKTFFSPIGSSVEIIRKIV